jgi:hypothetical protein
MAPYNVASVICQALVPGAPERDASAGAAARRCHGAAVGVTLRRLQGPGPAPRHGPTAPQTRPPFPPGKARQMRYHQAEGARHVITRILFPQFISVCCRFLIRARPVLVVGFGSMVKFYAMPWRENLPGPLPATLSLAL